MQMLKVRPFHVENKYRSPDVGKELAMFEEQRKEKAGGKEGGRWGRR